MDEYVSLWFMKLWKISFNDQQLDNLASLFMDVAKGFFLAIFALKLILPTDFLTLLGLLGSGIILVYASLWILERKKRKNGNKHN